MRVMNWAGLFLVCALTAGAQDAVPYSFNYQGVLRNGDGERLSNVNMSKKLDFRLYLSAGGNDVQWGRECTVMLDTNGLFNVELSDQSGVSCEPTLTNTLRNVIAGSSTLYLGVQVADGGNVTAEIKPRQQLLAVPFAMMAGDVRTASRGLTVSGALEAKGGAKVTGTLEAQNDLKLGGATLTSTDSNLNVPGLNVTGNATVSKNLNVAGDTTVSNLTAAGAVSILSSKNVPAGMEWSTPWDGKDKTLLDRAQSDGFIVISLYEQLNTNDGSDKNKLDAEFQFMSGSTCVRKVKHNIYIYDMDCYTYERTETIMLPVLKDEQVIYHANSMELKNGSKISTITFFVPFGKNQ